VSAPADGDPGSVAARVADGLRALLAADAVVIRLGRGAPVARGLAGVAPLADERFLEGPPRLVAPDELPPAAQALCRQLGVGGLLGVPLRDEQQRLGALVAVRTGRPFTVEELRTAEPVAGMAALTLAEAERAALARDEASLQRLLVQLAALCGESVPPEKMASAVLELAIEALAVDGAQICTSDGTDGYRVLASHFQGVPAIPTLERPFAGLMERAIAAGVLRWERESAPESVRSFFARSDYRSVAVAPILSSGRPVGVLCCGARRADTFGGERQQQLAEVAALIGPGLERVLTTPRTDAAAAQGVLELRSLQRVAEALSRTIDLDDVLGRCVDLAMEASHAAAGSIYLFDQKRGVYQRVAMRELSDAIAPPIIPVDRYDLTAISSSVLTELDFDADPAVASARAAGFRRAAVLALRVELELVGFLTLFFRDEASISPSTLLTLEALARYEAVAIGNARVLRRNELRARQAQVLREFGECALSPMSEAELHRLILDTALRISRSDRALFGSVRRGLARVVSGVGPDEQLVGRELPATTMYLQDALQSREPFVVEDTGKLDPASAIGSTARQQGTSSFLLLAVRAQNDANGLLLVGSGEPRRYEAEEIEAIQILATLAGEVLERARAQQSLRDEHKRLDAILEHLPIVVAVIARDGRMLHINAAGRRFAHEFATPNLVDWRALLEGITTFAPDGKPYEHDDLPLVQALRGQHPPPREMVLVSADGKLRRTILSVAAPLPSPAGTVQAVVTGFQDVSALRELADTKDRFLRIASHELRSPLTALRATTSLLDMDPSAVADPERRKVLLERVQRQVDRLTKLVEQLLDSARMNAAEPPLNRAELDLAQLCREAIEQAPLAATGHQIKLEAPEPVRGWWDRSRLEQVLNNLIGNAIRYSPRGSTITVRVRADEKTAAVEVIDQGIGIPAEQLSRLFTPFFRASNASTMNRGGLGLGLHISSEIVRRHGGQLRVASTVGVGSTFSVELPRTLQH
jgi:signal transduction histidine kinase/GAF domain-containing protein